MEDHKLIKWILYFLLVVFVIVGYRGISIYHKAYVSNVKTKKNVLYLKIPTGSTYEDVLTILKKDKILVNVDSFDWVARRKNYDKNINPGRYRIKNKMNNNQLVNMLKSGLQEPVDLTFNDIRTKKQLAVIVSGQIEADTASILKLLRDVNFLKSYNFEKHTVIGMFIPNTYEFWWNTDAETFFKKMNKEYEKFWNSERTRKAEETGLTRNEIITLASIIEEETGKHSEKPKIAGVYLNRLHKGIRLQADPTIKFAWNNFNMRRILKYHLDIESPYNTYKYAGIPPGPIRIPSIKSIDAVLNFEKSRYLYFCAKDDFSGYHVFAETLAQHNLNARLYQRALNKRRILH